MAFSKSYAQLSDENEAAAIRIGCISVTPIDLSEGEGEKNEGMVKMLLSIHQIVGIYSKVADKKNAEHCMMKLSSNALCEFFEVHETIDVVLAKIAVTRAFTPDVK